MMRVALAALVLAAFAVGRPASRAGVEQTAVDSVGHFPSVDGENLDGAHFALPGAFEGALNVVVVAFERGQQREVDGWMPFLRSAVAARRDVRLYELPTLARRYRIMRPLIDGGMRRGIPDKAVRATTITLYIDKAPFRASLRLPDEDRIYVLLVNRAGQVLWRADGAFADSAGTSLRRVLEESPPPAVDAARR